MLIQFWERSNRKNIANKYNLYLQNAYCYVRYYPCPKRNLLLYFFYA